MKRRVKKTPAEVAEAVAGAIAASDKSPAAIIDAVRGCGPLVWHILDSRPGDVYSPARGEWHPFLRQVRNSSRDGRRLFAAISAPVSL